MKEPEAKPAERYLHTGDLQHSTVVHTYPVMYVGVSRSTLSAQTKEELKDVIWRGGKTQRGHKRRLLNQSVQSKHGPGYRNCSHAKLANLTITRFHVWLKAWSFCWLSVCSKGRKIDIDKPAHVRWAAANKCLCCIWAGLGGWSLSFVLSGCCQV